MSLITVKRGHQPDYFLLAAIVALTIFGIAMLASASSNLGQTQFGDTYYYLKHQLLYGLSFGVAGFAVGYFFYYQNWKKVAFILLLLCLAALTLVFTPLGLTAQNASRWLRLGPLSFQPAELAKLAFIIYLAAWLANPKFKRATDFQSGLVPFLIITGLIAGLLILQPATSTVIILIASGLVVYFMSGAPFKYILLIALLGLIAIGLVIYITPYRRARILGFLNQSANTQGLNYQLNQSLIAIGSGGLTGQGYGQSATKTGYLPDAIDDSIFAIIAEELGFVGAGTLIALFAILAFRLFWLAKRTGEKFGRLLLIGVGMVIALQAFVNMAATSGLIPLTGVPLPFVSYGGTALAIFLTMCGIALNVSKYT
jgi:cell division protein FtsW